MGKTKQIEKLPDNTREYLPTLTPPNRGRYVYTMLFGLSLKPLQAIDTLRYRLHQDGGLKATYEIRSIDVSYPFSISTLFWCQQHPRLTESWFYYLSMKKSYHFYFKLTLYWASPDTCIDRNWIIPSSLFPYYSWSYRSLTYCFPTASLPSWRFLIFKTSCLKWPCSPMMNDYKYVCLICWAAQLHITPLELQQTRNKADVNFNIHDSIAIWK